MAERPRRRQARAGVAAALLLALVLAGCGAPAPDAAVVTGAATDDDGLHGAVLTEPYRLAEVSLVDTSDEPVTVPDVLSAPLTLVFFGYTHCPDICQIVMADLTSALARLEPAQRQDVAVWFVSTDPRRDTPAELRDYLARFDPSYVGLTGPLARIRTLAESAHIALEQGPRLPSGGYEVTHGTPVLAVWPDGTVPALWTEGTAPAELAEDVAVLLTDGVPAPEGAG